MRKIRTLFGRTTLTAAMALLIGAGAYMASPAAAQTGSAAPAKVDTAKAVKKDLIIFRNGQKAEGVVLEETDTTVRMLVIVGSMRSETTYQKSEILELKRDAFKVEPAKDDAKKDDKKDEKKEEPKNTDPNSIVDINGKAIPPTAVKVFVVNFGGEVGRDLSPTPLKEVMDEVVKVQPDILLVRFDHTFSMHGEEQMDFLWDAEHFNLLDKARELDTLLADRVNYDPNFKKRPRMVAWVKKALGAGAFLPFTFPEIYFTSDAHMGGIGGMENYRKMGDQVVQEKMRGIVTARAKGLAEKGGHDARIIEAMTRGEYILSYRVAGGKVELLERMPETPDEILLKDDGRVNQERTDSLQDIVRMKGNDYLTLDALTAFNIGFSDGTADTVDELLSKLGVTRDYAIVKNTSGKVLNDWSREISKAEADIGKLIRSYRGVEVKAPGGYKERTAARTQQKNYLRQVQSIAKTYGEAINPQRFGDASSIISQINVIINEIETAQRLDKQD